MKVIEINVGWSETHSLPEYCNVKPSVSYKIEIDEKELPDLIAHQYLRDAKKMVREATDLALEERNLRPFYYDGPRFQVLKSNDCKKILIMSNDNNEWPPGFRHLHNVPRGMRPLIALQKASELSDQYQYEIIDCSDGDMSKMAEFYKVDIDLDEAPF